MGALARTLEALLLPILGHKVFDYGSAADFRRLWDFDGLPDDRIVVVWSQTVLDQYLSPVNAADVLSPIDWAVAYAKLKENEPLPNILILDLQPDSNRSTPLYRQFNQMRPDLFPWLHVQSAPNISLAEILRFIDSPRNNMDETPENKAARIEEEKRNRGEQIEAHQSLLRSARMTLTVGGAQAETDRHAIANVIGPMVLRGGMPATEHENSFHAPALKKLLEACELISAATDPDTPDKIDTAGLHLVLIDDQAKQGWEEWLREITSGGTIEVITSPLPLIEALKDALEPDGEANKEQWPKDLRFQYDPGKETPSGSQPVLLLDLRLFSGAPTGEMQFLKDHLLPLIKNHFLRDDLAWRPFHGDEPHSVTHLQALTWLPRVLALADMSLPIILFSSTGRRRLVQSLTDYGNIITDFEKPRFHDTESQTVLSDVRSCATATLRSSLQQARSWLRFRQLAQRAESAQREIEKARKLSDGTSPRHYEIYFDESGLSRASGFRVAALVVGYDSEEHAVAVAERMQRKGISWFGKSGHYCYNKGRARDPHDLQRLGEKFQPETNDLWVMPLVLWSNPEDKQIASDALNADTLIQSLVAEALELCLFVLLPSNSTHTYAVYGAQRRIRIGGTDCAIAHEIAADAGWLTLGSIAFANSGIQLPETSRNAIARFCKRWGISNDRIDYHLSSTGQAVENSEGQMVHRELDCYATFVSISSAQDYGAILARTFQSRPWENPWKPLADRVGLHFSLLNHPKTASLDANDRPLHILADILPSDATWDSRGGQLNAFETFLPANASPGSVLIAEGAELSHLLGAGRALHGGDYALAFANVASLSSEFETHARYLYQAIYALLAEKIDRLHGKDLTHASHHLAALPTSTDGALPFSRINLRHQHWTRYPNPAPDTIKSLQEYCSNKLLVEFDAKPRKLEGNVADWILRHGLQDCYPGLVLRSREWMQDKPTGLLFAVITFDSTSAQSAYRQFSIVIPSTLRIEGSTKLHITLSLGPLPVGRLTLDSSLQVQWHDVRPIDLEDRGWTHQQIESVNAWKKSKCLPLPETIVLLRTLPVRAWREADAVGTYNVFFAADGLSLWPKAENQKAQACVPDDFLSDGRCKYLRTDLPIAVGNPLPKKRKISGVKTTINQAQPGPTLSQRIDAPRVWFGPVAMTIKFDTAMNLMRENFPNWQAEGTWAGSRDNSWIPLLRISQEPDPLPSTITLDGRQYRITDQNPDNIALAGR